MFIAFSTHYKSEQHWIVYLGQNKLCVTGNPTAHPLTQQNTPTLKFFEKHFQNGGKGIFLGQNGGKMVFFLL